MKRRRIRKWVKILLTSITIISSALVYVLTVDFGAKAQTSIFYTITTLSAWIWLFLGQFAVYYFIWENN